MWGRTHSSVQRSEASPSRRRSPKCFSLPENYDSPATPSKLETILERSSHAEDRNHNLPPSLGRSPTVSPLPPVAPPLLRTLLAEESRSSYPRRRLGHARRHGRRPHPWCKQALAAGWRVFERGGSTPDAVALGQNPRSASNTSGHAAYAVAILSVGKAAL